MIGETFPGRVVWAATMFVVASIGMAVGGGLIPLSEKLMATIDALVDK
jgi:hypothetical protein